jgi:hypothetical protein
VAVLLIGFTLRVVRLDERPLWWDEGNNVYFAHQDAPTVVRDTCTTRDTDPPVHRFALGVWQEMVGSSTFAMRFFSAVLGVLVIGLSWVVGLWLARRSSALFLALFVALAPLQVYHAREAKGYAFAAVCALLSTYAWGRRLGYRSPQMPPHGRKAHWWATYVLSTAAAIGTHYYLAPLLLWQGLWVLGHGAAALIQGRPPRRAVLLSLRQWTLAAGAIALLLAPWVLTVYGPTTEGVKNVADAAALSPLGYVQQVGQAFGAGPGQEGVQALAATVGSVALGALGALSAGAGGFLLSWIALPLAAAYLLQLAYPVFFPRFLLYLGPPYYLLISRGIMALGNIKQHFSKAVALLLVAAIVGSWGPGLRYICTRPVDQAEDPRPAIARLRALARPDDALVYVYIWQVGYVLGHFPQNELSFYRAYWTPQTVGEELTSIFDSHPRLWRMSYDIGARDPYNLANAWLEDNAYRVESAWYGRHNLALYVAPGFRTPGIGPATGTASFDAKIELRYPRVDAKLRPGDVLALPLRWRALAETATDYMVFVHVGLLDTPPLAQDDGQPHNGLEPTGTWTVGQEVLDRRALLLPPDIPPGRYRVQVGLYRPTDGTRLPLNGADGVNALSLGHVEVGR